MPDVKITIKNLAEIQAAFRQAPRLMATELDYAIKASIITIEADSKRNTPVQTGRLRASTYSKFAPLKGEIGTNTDYDIFVHEGTKFQRAQPYLRDAVESNEHFVERVFVKAVDNTLDKIGRMT